ncbi:MAG: AtpZ/AtpI family protein [Alphaproteobacteria bacterium]
MSENEGRKLSSEAVEDLDRRLRELRRKVESPETSLPRSRSSVGRMMWLSFHVVSDLIAGVICGLLIGYGFDAWFETRPIFIAVFLVFGCIAGVLNAVRFLLRWEEQRKQKEDNADGSAE